MGQILGVQHSVFEIGSCLVYGAVLVHRMDCITPPIQQNESVIIAPNLHGQTLAMKLRISLFAFLAIFSLLSRAQDRTYAPSGVTLYQSQDQALVIPCRPDMIVSDLDRELERTEGQPTAQVRETLRMALAEEVAIACDQFAGGTVLEPVEQNRSAYQQLFRGSSYEQRPMPELDPSKLERIRAVLESRSPEGGTRVEDGQILTVVDRNETYMQLKLSSRDAIRGALERRDFNYLICINELDIRVLRRHAAEMGQNWDRRIKVHYTILNASGEVVHGGAASLIYSGADKGLQPILSRHLPAVAAQIAADIALVANDVTPKRGVSQNEKPRRDRSPDTDDDF